MGGICPQISNQEILKEKNIFDYLNENIDIKDIVKKIIVDDNRKLKKRYQEYFKSIIDKLKKNKTLLFQGKKIKADSIGVKYYLKKYYFDKNNKFRCLGNLEYKEVLNKIYSLEKHSKNDLTKELKFIITEGYVNQGNQYLFQIVYENLRIIYKTYNLYDYPFPETPL